MGTGNRFRWSIRTKSVIFYLYFMITWTVNCHKIYRRQTNADLLNSGSAFRSQFPANRPISKQDPPVFDIYQPMKDPSMVGELIRDATPGVTYPDLLSTVKTNFTCRGLKGPGWYADPETGCQQYHRCYSELRKTSFICPPGTLFSQETLICDFWYNVNCSTARSLYEYANSRLYKQGVNLHGDAHWVPQSTTAPSAVIVPVPWVTNAPVAATPSTTPFRWVPPSTQKRLVQAPSTAKVTWWVPPAPTTRTRIVVAETTRRPSTTTTTAPPVTGAIFVAAGRDIPDTTLAPFVANPNGSYILNATSQGINQVTQIINNAIAEPPSRHRNNTGCDVRFILIQIDNRGANIVGSNRTVQVTEYCRVQRTPAEVRFLQLRAVPGVSYPVYTSFANAGFTCDGLTLPGWYDEPMTFCQQYYYCDENAEASTYLCPPGNLFNKVTLSCDAWYNVVCDGHVLLNSTTYGTEYAALGIPLPITTIPTTTLATTTSTTTATTTEEPVEELTEAPTTTRRPIVTTPKRIINNINLNWTFVGNPVVTTTRATPTEQLIVVIPAAITAVPTTPAPVVVVQPETTPEPTTQAPTVIILPETTPAPVTTTAAPSIPLIVVIIPETTAAPPVVVVPPETTTAETVTTVAPTAAPIVPEATTGAVTVPFVGVGNLSDGSIQANLTSANTGDLIAILAAANSTSPTPLPLTTAPLVGEFINATETPVVAPTTIAPVSEIVVVIPELQTSTEATSTTSTTTTTPSTTTTAAPVVVPVVVPIATVRTISTTPARRPIVSGRPRPTWWSPVVSTRSPILTPRRQITPTQAPVPLGRNDLVNTTVTQGNGTITVLSTGTGTGVHVGSSVFTNSSGSFVVVDNNRLIPETTTTTEAPTTTTVAPTIPTTETTTPAPITTTATTPTTTVTTAPSTAALAIVVIPVAPLTAAPGTTRRVPPVATTRGRGKVTWWQPQGVTTASTRRRVAPTTTSSPVVLLPIVPSTEAPPTTTASPVIIPLVVVVTPAVPPTEIVTVPPPPPSTTIAPTAAPIPDTTVVPSTVIVTLAPLPVTTAAPTVSPVVEETIPMFLFPGETTPAPEVVVVTVLNGSSNSTGDLPIDMYPSSEKNVLLGFGQSRGNGSQLPVLQKTDLNFQNGSTGTSGLNVTAIEVVPGSNVGDNGLLTVTAVPVVTSTNGVYGVNYRTIRYLEHRLIVRVGPFHAGNATTTVAPEVAASDGTLIDQGPSTTATPRQFRQLRRLQ